MNERSDNDHGARRQRVNGEGHRGRAERDRDRQQRRAVRDAGNEAIQRDDQEHGAGGHGAAEPGDKRGPPGQEAGERAERLSQIDVLAAGLRPQRGELGVGHRAHEREHAAAHPREQEPRRVRDRGRDRG